MVGWTWTQILGGLGLRYCVIAFQYFNNQCGHTYAYQLNSSPAVDATEEEGEEEIMESPAQKDQ